MVIRNLVVETDGWHSNKRVLISPLSLGRPDWSKKCFPAALTQAQVRSSPDIDTDEPVSRQQEMGYLGYYGYGNYWGGSGLWGGAIYPDMLLAGLGRQRAATASAKGKSSEGWSPRRSILIRQRL
jgi:hypothetical protein